MEQIEYTEKEERSLDTTVSASVIAVCRIHFIKNTIRSEHNLKCTDKEILDAITNIMMTDEVYQEVVRARSGK
mgnify:FL=1